MSLEKENQAIPSPPAEKNSKKLCYTRKFLLSLSKLDVCKKLPSGLDASILSELVDASGGAYERRPHSQNRLESSGGYVRGGQGRWETRSSGSSDKDGEPQPDREPLVQDTGRRFGNQTRRIWPNSEQDGLLGSGAFPRSAEYTGTPTPKARGNGHYQLNKSNEPYQPPRPYKAAPYSRKDFTDSYNDETFGSSECSSEDRAEEERKRRASFELMRKEQHNTLQEKHKANPENRKDVDIFAMLGNSTAGKNIRSGDKSDGTVAASLSHNDSSKSSLHIQTPGARPLVPPGFASASVEKILSVQSSNTSHTLEAGSGLIANDHSLNIMEKDQDKKNISAAYYTQFNMEKNEAKNISDLFVNANEKPVAPISSARVLEQALDSENVSGMATSIEELTEVWEDDIGNDFKHKNETVSEVMNTASQDHSTTILEKLFSSALSRNFGNSPNATERQVVKEDEENWSPELSDSSKFAHWFRTEEKNSIEDFSSRDLLSLINEKVNTQVSTSPNERTAEPISTGSPLENIESVLKLHSFSPMSLVVQKPDQYSQVDKKSPSSAVLTCEDLEQAILAEATDSSPSLQQPSIQVAWASFDGNQKEQKVDVDDHASQHLLFLLQKGTGLKELISSPGPDLIESSDRIAASEVTGSLNLHIPDNAVVRDAEMVKSCEKSITLETFFGSAFMDELHSAEAPVSAKRDPIATYNNTDIMQQHALQFPHADGSFFSSVPSESRSNKIIHEGEILAFDNTQKNPNMSVPWVGGYSDSSIEGPKRHGMGIEEGGMDIHLPEEDNLFTVGDTLKPVTSDPFPFDNAHKTEEFLRRNTIDDLNNRLCGAMVGDGERLRTRVPEGPSPLHDGPFIVPNNLYNHIHGRPSAQKYPHQMNQTRPLYPPLDRIAQRNALMNFVGPDGLHHDPHHFPGNVIPRHAFSSVGAPRFDPTVVHHPMLQHMPVPGNFPPYHPMQGLPGGIPPFQATNHMSGYIPDMNNIHDFSVHHQQPNYGGGFGMGLPESVTQGSGGHQPETLKRLIEMEIRANSKQNHPSVGSHIPGIPGIYSPELDMNFRYR
ncbi:Uncharacterized protein M6B38_216255 [Iris pallida]|uniref:Uncharacterized protein n=1 Tax=Iris pallida TaxID=29817 RepID=A0AAX6E016_IRIPA|nr:Uncharacterized protein M6B38_216255 [Iris pallida]